ncbi:MAG: putative DNA binding domain-containing protein [Acidobacteriota bacterium]|nr:putative DNA binding domain-containing protein [Blastocatellia bacterium]MDW8240779.1 putative DNA binding domain-containing protein [Acidobacteriota bacterium]
MSKRRPRRNHHLPMSARSFFEQRFAADHLTLDRTELLGLIHGGEDSYVELKVRFNNVEKIAAEVVALANSGGGFIVFGVTDQRRIEGVDDPEHIEQELVQLCQQMIVPPLHPYINKISFDNGKRVVALEAKGPHRPYFTQDHRCYIRIGSVKREATQAEISEMYNPQISQGYELIPVMAASLDDIDEALFWSYVREVRGGDLGELEAHGYPIDVVMTRYLRLAVARPLETVPTLAGLLLFGKNKRVAELWPRSRVIATRFAGTQVEDPIVEQVELQGNLATLYEATLAFLARYTDLLEVERPTRLWSQIPSPVPPRASYYRPAILEAVSNTLIHRDYTLRDVNTRLLIFDDRIELINPARSNGTPIEAYCYGVAHPPYPRMKAVFTSRYYGLPMSSGGLPMILHTSQRFSGLRPELRLINDEFKLKIYGQR